MVSVSTTQLCCCTIKAARDYGCGYVTVETLQNGPRFGLWDHSLPTPTL